MNTQTLADAFAARFGRPAAGCTQAPGRVNLIGEHTDYNDGFVLPIAINRRTLAAWAPREDRTIHLASAQQDQPAEIDLDATLAPGEPAWANYPKGVADGLIDRGTKLAGCDILFESDVPLGGGLSSSASLEVAAALALLAAADAAAPADTELARLCQRAEHDFAGAPCGIMDQSISIMARPGQALLLDCRTNDTRHVPFNDPELVLLVVNTEVKHTLNDGGYAARRDQCYAAAERLGVSSLRDATAEQVAAAEAKLDEKEFTRARHVVGEIARTLAACDALAAGDYPAFGELMYASHASLRDDYEVSCDELDTIVERAAAQDGVYGARMTGGGFGGCAIVLARKPAADAVADAIAEGFAARFGRRCPIFATVACGGASAAAL